MTILRALFVFCLLILPASAQQYVPGSGNLSTSQVTVGATATLILSAHPGRSNVAIINLGATTVCLGNSTGVTLLTGLCLPSGSTSNAGIIIPYAGALYGITASSSIVSVGELF